MASACARRAGGCTGYGPVAGRWLGAVGVGLADPACGGCDGFAEPGQRGGVGVIGRGGVADDQCRAAAVLAGRVRAESLDRHVAGGGTADSLVFVLAGRQRGHGVQAGRDPG